ncbi:MAG: alpha/beta hydrolase [Armatimonadaceae bacterium]
MKSGSRAHRFRWVSGAFLSLSVAIGLTIGVAAREEHPGFSPSPANSKRRQKAVSLVLRQGVAILVLRQGVAINGVGRGGRRPFGTDAVVYALLTGKDFSPQTGDNLPLPDGAMRSWEAISANDEGWFQGRSLSGGAYLYTTLDVPREGTYLLVAQGHNLVYVNGTLHMGDPYAYGYLKIPVRLREGKNTFLFSCSRGRLRAELFPVAESINKIDAALLHTDDMTLPDLRAGDEEVLWGAVHVINTTEKPLSGLKLRATVPFGEESRTIETDIPTLPPLSVRKTSFRFAPPKGFTGEKADLRLQVAGGTRGNGTQVTASVRVRKPNETHKRTFISEIDGTVQYYAVGPAQKPSPENTLILSLHGASVEAIGQADAYGLKDWATLIAPTNRRPFGFDWEDWGRLDAIEVLTEAQKIFPHDPSRVHLTGHSMGGHGTWSVGAWFPDRFGAIGPSAGWISFDTYAGGPRVTENGAAASPVALVNRAANLNDTLALASNLLLHPVYILHGDADDNVPVGQARRMREELEKRQHPALLWHEEKGAGHWWDNAPDPGADCVDWKPMFSLFQQTRLAAGPVTGANTFTFTTVSPGVSAQCRWVRVEQQAQMLLPSTVQTTWEPNSGYLRATTENITRLTLLPPRLSPQRALFRLEVDGQAIVLPKDAERRPALHLIRRSGKWSLTDKPAPESEKNPERTGPFKNAFHHRFVLIYGTAGTAEENKWAYERARYDAESFLYRGNGSPELIADTGYKSREMRDRSVILYGNSRTNRLWNRLLAACPVQVDAGKVRIGSTEKTGDALACLFVYPKPDSRTALVGAVSGTGLSGMRCTDRIPYFVSGVNLPDWTVFDAEVYRNGVEAVSAAGYFTNDWKLAPADQPQ